MTAMFGTLTRRDGAYKILVSYLVRENDDARWHLAIRNSRAVLHKPE
jgi:hypothetical protein